ncbi:hypothetical protein [Actinomadura sp. K4S16]|uniref:hypothetical protein n=1 Tax=Actinomadura sp. K4S16 TaxID=1316147 RepID=UPI0011EC14C6|nr:hypothetical protein [Actinomadura sp. K4S16]
MISVNPLPPGDADIGHRDRAIVLPGKRHPIGERHIEPGNFLEDPSDVPKQRETPLAPAREHQPRSLGPVFRNEPSGTIMPIRQWINDGVRVKTWNYRAPGDPKLSIYRKCGVERQPVTRIPKEDKR